MYSEVIWGAPASCISRTRETSRKALSCDLECVNVYNWHQWELSSHLPKWKLFPGLVIDEVNTWHTIREDIENSNCYQLPIQSIKLMIRSVVDGKVTWRSGGIRYRVFLEYVNRKRRHRKRDAQTLSGESTRNPVKPDGVDLFSLCMSVW